MRAMKAMPKLWMLDCSRMDMRGHLPTMPRELVGLLVHQNALSGRIAFHGSMKLVVLHENSFQQIGNINLQDRRGQVSQQERKQGG